jgi:RIO kinase 1
MPQVRAVPGWVITHDYEDEELGTLRSGKEAGCFLVRRVDRSAPERYCLLVRKDYRKRSDRTYNAPVRAGERAIRRDMFMESVSIRLPSERKAVRAHNALGRALMEEKWSQREFVALQRLWDAGARVPYPVEKSDHGFLMQYVGTIGRGAPRLADARPSKGEAVTLFERLVDQLKIFAREEMVHGDLSAYNVLVQHGHPWIIDMPQAVDLDHSQGPELFHRDVANLCRHFTKYGIRIDARALTEELLGS